MRRKRNESTEAVWRDRLARFGESGLTVKEFCRTEGVSDPSFYQWRKRLEGSQSRTRTRSRRSSKRTAKSVKAQPFVPVSVSSLDSVEVEFPNGVQIRIPANNVEALRVVIAAGNEVGGEIR